MINNVVLCGRITKDIELAKTPSGVSVVKFTLACNRRFKQEGQQEADFINCVAWRQSADFLSNYAHKGDLISVQGRIETRNYNANDGHTVYVTEVVCEQVSIEASKQNNTNATPQPQQAQNNTPGSFESDFGINTLDIASDDLPF